MQPVRGMDLSNHLPENAPPRSVRERLEEKLDHRAGSVRVETRACGNLAEIPFAQLAQHRFARGCTVQKQRESLSAGPDASGHAPQRGAGHGCLGRRAEHAHIYLATRGHPPPVHPPGGENAVHGHELMFIGRRRLEGGRATSGGSWRRRTLAARLSPVHGRQPLVLRAEAVPPAMPTRPPRPAPGAPAAAGPRRRTRSPACAASAAAGSPPSRKCCSPGALIPDPLRHAPE